MTDPFPGFYDPSPAATLRMVWPFKKQTTGAERPPERVETPKPSETELRLVEEVLSWFSQHAPDVVVRPAADAHELHLDDAPTGDPTAPAGAVIGFKRGKINRVDLYDPDLRPVVNKMIAHFDRLQKWSFNGVVSTKYDERRVDGTT